MNAPATDDRAAWLVYADWLQAQPEEAQRALGEAIVLEWSPPSAERTRLAAQLCERHGETWLGPLAEAEGLRFEGWAGAFPRSGVVQCDSGEVLTALVRRLLSHPLAGQVERLELTLADYDGDQSAAPALSWLCERQPPRLRALSLREPLNFGSPWHTTPPHVGDVSRLWGSLKLEALELDGQAIALGEVHAPALRELGLRFVGGEALGALARSADLGALEELRLSLDGPDAVPALVPLLRAGRLPRLRALSLGSWNTQAHEPLLELLPRLDALGQLELLDFGWMRIQDSAVPILSRHQQLLAHIGRVRVNVRNLSADADAGFPKLGQAFERVRFRFV